MFDRALFGRYLVVTVFSASVLLAGPYVLHEWLGVGKHIAVAIAFIVALIANFIIARFYVFRSRNNWRTQFARFAITSASMRVGEYLAFLAVHMWTDLYYVLAVLIVLLVSFVLKFVIYRTFVFGAAADVPG
jgi:putative flippase GtrA